MIFDSPVTKSLIAFLPASSSLMLSLISVLKVKLTNYMLSLLDSTAEYEDYEVWGQGFAKQVAVFDCSACGQDMPELADFITKAKCGLDPMATNNWLQAAHVVLQHQQAAEEQALVEKRECVAITEWEAAKAEATRAAVAQKSAKVQCRTSKVNNFANSPGRIFWDKLSSDLDSGKKKESKNALYGSFHGKIGVANFLGKKKQNVIRPKMAPKSI
ncbi:hypothetical protein HETIRDRAFT_428666 [Heterobasidion irregulare TC 32-1]|uniref:Uncharacterized protein n=1 Tax=Heterobasidion irregulare (strain TC 32-1) TaxID=747525 RepID=W4JZJ9_HETIT|nr:uncharacterized protein HETIRDRAFT_428666 [Heterobasidion irregulare TC 32-1]ETW78894.1 hypothetical protein HETIRDRAFT_428666 [Heterobasidion irregulare TC 32-1]